MSNLEKWIKAILNEDADNLSIGSVRTLQMIKHEFERLQRQVADLEAQSAKEVKEKSPVDGTPYVNLNPINKVEEEKKSAEEILKKHLEIVKNPSQWPEKYKALKLYSPYIEAMQEYKYQSAPALDVEEAAEAVDTFLNWAFKNYQWTGDTWDENTGHDDFESYTHKELFQEWQSLQSKIE